MHQVSTPRAPAPAGHYSQGMAHAGLVFVATQLPLVPDEPPDPTLHVRVQAERALRNVLGVVEAAGGSARTLLRVTIYLTDITRWGEVNEVYASVLGEARPARGVVQVAGLHHGMSVAIDAIAALI